MSNFTYNVNSNNIVRIYRLSQTSMPIILQPNYPDNRPFENKEAAEKWAQDYILNLNSPPLAPENA